MNGLVSIIIPCYNDGIYIKESIYSAIKQSYTNIEIIIVDDGSDDEITKNILKNISGDNIQIFYIDKMGPAYARNYAIQKSHGEFILPLDADDKIDTLYVEKAVNILKENPNIGIVYCKASFFGENSGTWKLPEYSLRNMLLDNIIFVTAMFRKQDWELIGGFYCGLESGLEDYDFWLSIIELGRIVFQIPEIMFYYRIKHKSRNVNFANMQDKVKETYETIFQRHRELYIKNIDGYSKVMRDRIIDLNAHEKDIKFLSLNIIKIAVKSIPFFGRIINLIYKKYM